MSEPACPPALQACAHARRRLATSHSSIHHVLPVLCCCCSAAAAEGSEPPPEAQEDDLWDVVEGEVLPPAIRRYLWTRRLKDTRKEKVRGGAHRPPPTGWREEGRGGGRDIHRPHRVLLV